MLVARSSAATYYVDSALGHDQHGGLAPDQAWQSLDKVNSIHLQAGDSVLLKRGSRFGGSLIIDDSGVSGKPILVGAYGTGPDPVIDAYGYLAAVLIRNAQHIDVRDLELTGDGGEPADSQQTKRRYGVRIEGASSHVTIESLQIHDIFPERGSPHEGRKPNTHLGIGIGVAGGNARASDITIRNCRIARTGFKGIELNKAARIQVVDNHLHTIGGPGIQPGEVEDLVVRGNVVDGSGSSTDPRMHGRGSGIWPWKSSRVLIERNVFKHARGKGDSCGIHIDFHCRDVVVQYNLSIDNEGGFVEILGDNFNCAYRYNISVNDGARVKGRNGAHQEGKVLWTSGYVGNNRPKTGPVNSYIYNNTIFVGPDSRSCFSIGPTTDGLLVANNVFHIMGQTLNVLGDQDQRLERSGEGVKRAFVHNNLYLHADILPASLPFTDAAPLVGDPQFANPGGLAAADYMPANVALIRDRGIAIEPLPGDDIGLRVGLQVTADFFGNPIIGLPDLGAIELPVAAPR
jgi:hypothetical protein